MSLEVLTIFKIVLECIWSVASFIRVSTVIGTTRRAAAKGQRSQTGSHLTPSYWKEDFSCSFLTRRRPVTTFETSGHNDRTPCQTSQCLLHPTKHPVRRQTHMVSLTSVLSVSFRSESTSKVYLLSCYKSYNSLLELFRTSCFKNYFFCQIIWYFGTFLLIYSHLHNFNFWLYSGVKVTAEDSSSNTYILALYFRTSKLKQYV